MPQLTGLLALLGAALQQEMATSPRVADSQEWTKEAQPIRWQAGAAVGKGLRFNNPYRLPTPLGSTARSLSLAAAYGEFSAAALWPGGFGERQGARLSLGLALEGIGQWVAAASYVALFELSRDWELVARAGVPVVVAPDVSLGGEAALGLRISVSDGLKLESELVGDLFGGAATAQRAVTFYPLLSFQMGITYQFGLKR